MRGVPSFAFCVKGDFPMSYPARRRWIVILVVLFGVATCIGMGILNDTPTDELPSLSPSPSLLLLLFLPVAALLLGPVWTILDNIQNRASREFVDREVAAVIERLRAHLPMPLAADLLPAIVPAVAIQMADWKVDRQERISLEMFLRGAALNLGDVTPGGVFIHPAWSAPAGDHKRQVKAVFCGEVWGRLATMGLYRAEPELPGRDMATAYTERFQERFARLSPSEGYQAFTIHG